MKTLREGNFDVNNDAFSERLNEANEFFADKYKTNIIGKDFETVVANDVLFNQYRDRLTEGFTPAQESAVNSLIDNSRVQILKESSISGVEPYQSLTMPIMVKLWARLSMTEAIPTEPTETPSFTIPFMEPWIKDGKGNKIKMPEGINSIPQEIIGLKELTPAITITEGKLENYDLFTGLTGIRKEVDHVDPKFSIVEATIDTVKVALKGQKIVCSPDGQLYGEIKYVKDDAAKVETLIGRVDFQKNTLTLISVSGKTTAIKIKGYVSSEAHSYSTQTGVDYSRRNITVGTGQHIEGSLPLEYLQDLKAMYDVDGTAVIADLMSATSAQDVDTDLIQFVKETQEATEAAYERSFDVYPNSDYAMHPSEWLTGLRKTIDYVATSMRSDYKSYDARFVIIGHPLDTDLIPNVEWTFRDAENQVAGIDVQYSIGALRGSNAYKIVSSDLVPQGKLYIVAVPTRENYRTLTYFPYTFNVVKNYLNTENPNVPSLMLTRRNAMEAFTPIVGSVKILHNDGSVYAR